MKSQSITSQPQEWQRHRVVVVGGGVAGLVIASRLGRRWKQRDPLFFFSPSMTLIESDTAHVWKPMHHIIAADTHSISQQQTTYLAQARDAGFIYEFGEVCGLDRAVREVAIAPVYEADGRLLIPERRVKYDTLILAVGSRANDFATPGVNEHCLTLDSRLKAEAFNHEVRIRVLQCVKLGQELLIAIVGGGATGVELAAELLQLIEASSAYGVSQRTERIAITLIESGPRLLSTFPTDISSATQVRLIALGIRVITNACVSRAEAHELTLTDGRKVPASLKIWAAGNKAPDLLTRLDGLETNDRNQLLVLPSLCTTLDTNIYALGDCASFARPRASHPLPLTAQVAHQQAQHLIRHLERNIVDGIPVPDFTYRDFGSLFSLGDYDAYGPPGQFGPFAGGFFRGRLAQLSHSLLYRSHQSSLHGFYRGSLLWLIDWLNARLRPTIRLD
ncbi:FAD-dependent oxidoreductase [Agrobacterium sp. SORGH_AS 787]|uniref:NAD(P)/FAD-dependent oxidoreductase n=1 Tax=Agrobacterium sp. SORGH_AS 787 TaxID=3041775 RepID=UPI0032B773D5